MTPPPDRNHTPCPDPHGDTLQSRLHSLPFQFSQHQIDQLESYIALFRKWNSRFGFSRYESPAEIVESLVVPSLLLGLLVPPESSAVDLGTGPGIPGIPLKILFPQLKLALVESSERLLEFLRALISDLHLDDMYILEGRAEDLAHDPDLRSGFDLAIARAFAPLPIVSEISSAYVRPGGKILIQCSADTSSALEYQAGAIGVTGTLFDRVGAIVPPMQGVDPVYFALFIQCDRSPDCYPRTWKKMKNQPLWR